MFFLRDPEGISESSLLVSREVLFLISLMDGTRSVRDLQAEYTRAAGMIVYTEYVNSVIEAMDSNFLLLNERYESHIEGLREAYQCKPSRNAFLSGKSYPAAEAELRTYLGQMLESGDDQGRRGPVRGVIVPHIDYARGAEVYSQVYGYLPKVDDLLIVVLGTCHKMTQRMWSISLKDFETPLGIAKGVREVGSLVREDGLLKDYVDEWPHRTEHSIELQLPIIQYLLAGRSFEILPILTGSFHEYIDDGKRLDEELPQLIESLRKAISVHAGPAVIIAAADLAHIGAQFGDSYRLDSQALAQSRRKDEQLLRAISEVDAVGFFETVKREGDRRRICGLAPIYFILSLLGPCKGESVGYKQWTDGASSVSFAGAIFY